MKCSSLSALLQLLLVLWLSFSACIKAGPHTLQDQGAILTCSKKFILHNKFCYRYFGSDLRKPFHHAQKLCSRYESSLVSLHSLQEEHFVLNLAHNHTGFWIGLNDEDGPSAEHREGLFKWTSGEEPSSYCRWKPGEPNNKRHLDCVKADVEGWAMAPGGCATSRLPFVCKKTACIEEEYWDGSGCVPLKKDSIVMFSPELVVIVFIFILFGMCCAHLRTKTVNNDLFPT